MNLAVQVREQRTGVRTQQRVRTRQDEGIVQRSKVPPSCGRRMEHRHRIPPISLHSYVWHPNPNEWQRRMGPPTIPVMQNLPRRECVICPPHPVARWCLFFDGVRAPSAPATAGVGPAARGRASPGHQAGPSGRRIFSVRTPRCQAPKAPPTELNSSFAPG